jgi:hypothetical protein
VDGIKEMLDRLSDLDEGQLSDLESKIIGEFETVEKQEPTAQVVDSMTALADALDAVRGEQTSRVAAQKDLEERAAQAAARVKPKQEEDPANGDNPPADDSAPVDAEPVDAPSDVPVEAPTDVPPAEPEAEAPPEETEEEKEKKKAAPGSTFENADDEKKDEEKDEHADEAAVAPAPEPTEPAAAPAAEAAPAAPVETPPVEVPAAQAVVPGEVVAPSPVPSARTEEIPVAASASDVVVTPPAENRPVPRESATVAITAGADIPGISAGTVLANSKQVADAFVKRLHNLQRVSQPNGQQYTVATLTASFPEDRQLEQGDVDGNWDKIQKVAGVEAIVAASGSCIPLEIRYDIYGVGDTDTPVQDSLPRFTADRGGIRFYPGPLLPAAHYDQGIGVWDPTDGSVTDIKGGALDPVDEKPCYPVECLPFTEAVLEAVTMCLCFDNLTGRVFPELVARHNELALIQHARVTEQFMLEKIFDQSTHQITAKGTLAAAPDILTQVDRVAAALRYRNRISPTQSFRVILPYWLKDMIRSDLAMRMPGDGGTNFTAADNVLDGWFRARNINVTWALETHQSAAATSVPKDIVNLASNCDWWPTTVEWDIFAEGTWLVLDGGTLDLGVIRDSSHVANNTYCEFTESFYNVTRVGGESVHVTSTLAVTGSAADLSDACV